MNNNYSKVKSLRVAKTVLPDYKPEFNDLMRIHQETLKALYIKLSSESLQTTSHSN